jgi:hypothetical protein
MRSGQPAQGDKDFTAARAIDPMIAATFSGYGLHP